VTGIPSKKIVLRPGFKNFASALALGAASLTLPFAVAAPAHAQEVNASLRGTVTVEGGASQITAVDVNSGITRTSPVAADGTYNFASLRPGTYRLEVTTPSGVRRTDEFTLEVAQNAVLDFDLAAPTAPAETAEPGAPAGDSDIVVVGQRIRSMEGGEVGVNITQRLIEHLPQNNRNFLAFADLAPGVQFITNASGQSRLQGGAQDSRTVNVFIDGVGQKDYVLKNGITGQDSTQGNPFPQLAIGEYRVISSNYKAEFDQVSSVAITAVTKSGTNEFHGEGFVDFTNQHLRSATPRELRDGEKIKTKDIQFGGALGGPIIRDVMHFFVTYEGKRRIQPREVSPGLDLPVTFFPSEYQGFFGSAQEEFNENLYFGKIDFSPTSKDLFEVSVKYRDESGETFNSGLAAFETRTIAKVEEWRGLARWEHSEETWINDFKLAYEDVTWGPRPAVQADTFLFNATVTDPSTGLSRRGDILRIGGGSNFQDKGQKGWSIQNDFTYTGFENHTIKVGAKAKWVTLNTFQANNTNPVYTFNVGFNPGGGTFNDTIPYRVTFFAPFGDTDPRIESDNFQFGIYAQDDWDVTDRLTVNFGVRWDYERTPAFLNYKHNQAVVDLVTGVTINPATGLPAYPNLLNADYDINDFISTGSEREAFKGAIQPRIGFSYDIDGDRRWVLFGGYGRSYDRNQFDFIQQELAQGLATNRTFNFLNAGSPEPCAPSVTCVPFDPIYLTPEGRAQLIANAPPGAGGELRFINNDLKMPYSDQFSLGLRHRVNNLTEVEVGYSHIVSKDGFVFLLGNRRPDGSFFPPTGNPSSPFGNPPSPFGSIIIGDNGLETKADSAYVKLNKTYTRSSPWSLTATYTYTEAEENRQFGEVFSLDFPSADDYPFVRSAGVRKHRLVMAGTVDIPLGFTLSGKFQIASPKYLQSFTFVEGDPLSRDVTAVKTEGNGDRWGFRELDLALTKYLTLPFLSEDAQIWVRVDVLNVMNDRNFNSFNAVTGDRNPNNLDIDGPPRTFKLSTGFAF
jgi:outer membrane receptor protein involved in Fe transport